MTTLFQPQLQVDTATSILSVRDPASGNVERLTSSTVAVNLGSYAANTAALAAQLAACAISGLPLTIPADTYIDTNATIDVVGFVEIIGGGTIRLNGVNGPAIRFNINNTGSGSVQFRRFGPVNFIAQGIPASGDYSPSCAIEIAGDGICFFQYITFDQITCTGFNTAIKNSKGTRTTSYGQENNVDWVRFSRITTFSGTLPAKYAVWHLHGSGTGNSYEGFRGSLNATGAAYLRIEGSGTVCGDILMEGAHVGGPNAVGISFGPGLTYTNRILIDGQFDAAMLDLFTFDDPTETFNGITVLNANIGGGLNTYRNMPPVATSRIDNKDVSVWRDANMKQSNTTGAQTIALFAMNFAAGYSGTAVEIQANGLVGGVSGGVARARIDVQTSPTALTVSTSGLVQNPASAGFFNFTTTTSELALTINVTLTPTSALSTIEAQLRASGGTFNVRRL